MFILRWISIQLGAQPWLHKFSKYIVGSDKLIQRLTRGKLTLLSFVGLPQVFLTVAGRKSGIPRTTPLLCVPYNGGWLVAGSNWGAPKAPAWVGNLAAASTASVLFKGKNYAVTPRQLVGEERETAWRVMNQTWPNYDKYAVRTGRDITVWMLSPVS